MPNIILITTIAIVSALIGFFISTWITKRKLRLLESISEQIKKAENKKKDLDSSLFSHYKIVETKKAEADLAIKRHREEMQRAISDTDEIKSSIQKYRDMIDNQKSILSVLRDETAHLKKMKDESVSIQEEYDKLDEKRAELIDLQVQRDILVDQISLYTDMDTYIDSGLYPLPSYGEFSAGGYSEILKDNRAAQKEMLKKGDAYTYPHNIVITGNPDYDNRCAMSQGQLLVRAFNSECDYLISKISTKNYEATMTRIEQLAEKLEKMLVTLEVGLSLPYVELKMQECSIFYQYQCRKALEAEEQREIRAQMREEAAAQREIEKALRDAEREEMIIQQTMQKVRQEMAAAGEMQRLQYEAQLSALQHKLIEAEAKGQRALSMAQQTRRGHVYIISNIGSFGEDLYKIGMTRRLEPIDRVNELGDASVPFPFDIHAMIYSEDAPTLERELHNHFADMSVNKINPRKEFFAVSLEEIKNYLDNKHIDVRWTMTADAAEYRQSLQIAEQRDTRAA